jgi:outer membrane protein insertion porin family
MIAWSAAAAVGLAGCAGTPWLVNRPLSPAATTVEDQQPIPSSAARVVRSQDPDSAFRGATLPSYRGAAELPERTAPVRPAYAPRTAPASAPAAFGTPPAASPPARDYSGYGGRGASGPSVPSAPHPAPVAVAPPAAAAPLSHEGGYLAPEANPFAGSRTAPLSSVAGFGGRGESGPFALRAQSQDPPPGDVNVLGPTLEPYTTDEPDRWLNIKVVTEETETGRLMFGVGENSDAGVVGNVVIDEQNFDWQRVPGSWSDFANGTAFRGAGQRFRLEAAPGSQVSRYLLNFQEPYLRDTPVSFGLSGFYYNRMFNEWYEDRLGGRTSLGYQFPDTDLSVSGAVRYENVKLFQPIVPTPAELTAALGSSNLIGFRLGLVHDTRDSPFLSTDGHYAELSFEQVVGTYTYPRFEGEYRRYFLLHERPDSSGRHTLSLKSKVSITGNDTPIYEKYYAGGFSTLRGFAFRGVSPRDLGVVVGGDFMFINTIEYMFPITADDMLKAVTFVDFGTVEQNVTIDSKNFRIAPGVGLRVTVPAMGPAPIALDFAFPIADAAGDQHRTFSFFIGFGR